MGRGEKKGEVSWFSEPSHGINFMPESLSNVAQGYEDGGWHKTRMGAGIKLGIKQGLKCLKMGHLGAIGRAYRIATRH